MQSLQLIHYTTITSLTTLSNFSYNAISTTKFITIINVNKHFFSNAQQAVNSNNRRVARFLYDSLLFQDIPYWTPSYVYASMVISFFLLIHYFGAIYGLVYYGAVYVFCSWTLMQYQIVDHKCRVDVGLAIGLFVVLVTSFYYYVYVNINAFLQLLCVTLALVLVFLCYKFYRTKPVTAKVENKAVLAQLIIDSATPDGPEEDYEQYASSVVDEVNDSDSKSKANAVAPTKKMVIKFVRDPVNGRMVKTLVPAVAVDNNVSNNNNINNNGRTDIDDTNTRTPLYGSRTDNTNTNNTTSAKRGIAPRLCGTCLCDKRSIYYIDNNDRVVSNTNAIASAIAATNASTSIGSSVTAETQLVIGDPSVRNTHDPVIAMATHCYACRSCVEDVDHHAAFLGCVRAFYCLFMIVCDFVRVVLLP